MTGNGPAAGPGRPAERRGPDFRPRFAGEVFATASRPKHGPYLDRLTSEIAWKRNPSQEVATDLSR